MKIEITVNGKGHEFESERSTKRLNYWILAGMAGFTDPFEILTMTFHRRGGPQGEILRGQQIDVESGTVFNISRTGNT